MDQREHVWVRVWVRVCACTCIICMGLNSTCVGAVLPLHRMCVPCRSRVYVCVPRVSVCIHSTPVSDALSRVRVKINIWRHWVMITPRCAYRTVPPLVYVHAYMHTCVHRIRRGRYAWAAHASGTICRISRNFRIALVTRGVNNVYAPKLFPSRNGGRASRCAFIGRF